MPRSRSSSRRRRMLLGRSHEVDVLTDAARERAWTGADVIEEDEFSESPIPSFGAPEGNGSEETDVVPDEWATIPLRIDDDNRPWRAEVRALVDDMQPRTWVFTGDGLTQAANSTNGHRGYVELFDERIRGHLRRLLDVVVNTGLEGGRARMLLRSRDWRIDRFRPDVVSMMLGTSDAAAGSDGIEPFRESVTTLVESLLEEGSIVVLNTPPRPTRRAERELPDLRAYVRTLREVAEETGVPIVDHWNHWRNTERAGMLAADGLHPNADGHRELLRLLLRELGIE